MTQRLRDGRGAVRLVERAGRPLCGTARARLHKLLMCAAGSITFLVGPDATAVAVPGDGFVLPAGTPHAAVVGPGGCTCTEGHRSEG